MNGLIGKKIGMTSIYDKTGNRVACTVIEAGKNVITQLKTTEGRDGYDSIQLAFGEVKEKNVTKPMKGHFEKANVSPKYKVKEFKNSSIDKKIGDELLISEVLKEGEKVHVIGVSKGKGFQGVVKRHGFGGVGQATHGQHNRLRAPGSIGACSTPSKVIKGMKMAGRMGTDNVKTKNLEIVKIYDSEGLVVVKGCVAGHKGSYVIIEK